MCHVCKSHNSKDQINEKKRRAHKSVNNTSPRDPNLDLAKAMAISLVLFWHLKPIQIMETSESSAFIKSINFLLVQFYAQVSLLAVPLFFLVSLYLFFSKANNNIWGYMKKRCLSIGEIYLFWTGCQFIFFYIDICHIIAYRRS